MSSAPYYIPVVLLHATVGLRIVGDLVDELGRYRAWGGMLNAIAMVIFLANTARVVLLKGGSVRAPRPR